MLADKRELCVDIASKYESLASKFPAIAEEDDPAEIENYAKEIVPEMQKNLQPIEQLWMIIGARVQYFNDRASSYKKLANSPGRLLFTRGKRLRETYELATQPEDSIEKHPRLLPAP